MEGSREAGRGHPGGGPFTGAGVTSRSASRATGACVSKSEGGGTQTIPEADRRPHMLVLIRDWLLAGVSSPWLPSRGGDWGGDGAAQPRGRACAHLAASPRQGRPRPHLDVNLVTQHGRPQDHRLGASLELLPHQQRLLKGGAALIHIPGVQDLRREGRGSAVLTGSQGPPPAPTASTPVQAPCCGSRCGR